MNPKTDEVLELYQSGANADSVMRLMIQNHKERLYWHIRKMVIDHSDADDVLQMVFVKAWKGLKNFRQEASLSTWLYRIASNESITFLNKKRKRYFIPINDIQHELQSKVDEYFGPNGDEIEAQLQKALLTLPDKQRMVFNMKYYDDLKYEEISKILGTSVGGLKASYHHAVKKIEHLIKNE